MSMAIKRSFIKQILKNNEWLNGLVDYRDGDPTQLLEAEKIFSRVVEGSLKEIFNYMFVDQFNGVYKYRNIWFFNSYEYGCFVYLEGKPNEYIEHFTYKEEDFEKFKERVEELLIESEMRWEKGDSRLLPFVAIVDNNQYVKPKVYNLVYANVIWANVVKITKNAGSFKIGFEDRNYFWRVVYVDNREYKWKEFKYLKEAKKYAKEKILEKLKNYKFVED